MPIPTFAKGVGFGGRNDFDISQGGAIRQSFPVEASATFSEGNCLEQNDDGTAQLSTAQVTKLTGITDTRRSTVGDQENDHTLGSGKVVILLDQAVVTTIELTSGAVFVVNDRVFQDEAGSWTQTQPGTDIRVYGTALTAAVANAGDTLTLFYEGAQTPTA